MRYPNHGIWRLVFLLLPLIWFLFCAPRGFSDTDPGFIAGMSWRILCGQVPYEDFIYVRPPLSLYFHAGIQALLPEHFEMIGERFLFYLMLASSCAFTVFSFKKFFEEYLKGISPWAVASLGFILSAHNYPPMPWHTTDGIFFAALGFFLLTIENRGFIVFQAVGFFCLSCSCLCKQPFLITLPSGLILVYLLYGTRALFISGSLLLIFHTTGLIIFQAFYPAFVPAMLSDILGQLKLGDLIQSGLSSYFFSFCLAAGSFGIAFFLDRSGKIKWILGATPWLILLVLILLNALLVFIDQKHLGPVTGWAKVFFILGFSFAVEIFLRNRKAGGILIAFLITAWASGLSWGYSYPVFGLTAACIAVLAYSNRMEFNKKIIPIIAGAAGILFLAMSMYPYRDRPQWDCQYDLGEIFPVMSGIKTSEENFMKNSELKILAMKYGPKFTVMPCFPHAHYLTRSIPFFPVDFESNAECNLEKKRELIKLSAWQNLEYVLIEKNNERLKNLHPKFGSEIGKWITEEWLPEEQTEYFVVYRNPREIEDGNKDFLAGAP